MEKTAYSSKCVPNPCSIESCSLCSGTGTCIKCKEEYFVYNETSKQCENQCTLGNCKNCLPTDTACAKCKPGYALDFYTKLCVESKILNCPQVYTRNNEQLCYSCDHSYYLDYQTEKKCSIWCSD